MRYSHRLATKDPFLPYTLADAEHVRYARRSENPLLLTRQAKEDRLAHVYAAHPRAISVSRELASRVLRYIEVRARKDSSRPSDYVERLKANLCRVLRPVALPFAGRLTTATALLNVLRGDGNVRELQSSTWLAMSHLITEDLVGPQRRPDAFEIAALAGFDIAVCNEWIRATLERQREAKTPQLTVDELDPYELFRLTWHPIRRCQIESRVQITRQLLSGRRCWSQERKADFVAAGGILSGAEACLKSPLGDAYLPWLDARRLFAPNPRSELFQYASENSIPLATGLSGVAIQVLTFARVLKTHDLEGVKAAVFGYLMSIKSHTFYELMLSTMSDEHPGTPPLDYGYLDPGALSAPAAERSME